MLILSRRPNESVILTVGEIDIELKVVKLSGDTVKLGFEAPREVVIVREEVLERMQECCKEGHDFETE